MRRRITVFILVLLFAGLAFWQREKVVGWLGKQPVLAPVFGKPQTYDLAQLLEKNGFNLSAPPISLDGSIYASISGVLVLFSPEKDLPSQIRALQLVFPKVKMESKVAREIDLRFGKVVIRY